MRPEWKIEWMVLWTPWDLPSHSQKCSIQRHIQAIWNPQGNFTIDITVSFITCLFPSEKVSMRASFKLLKQFGGDVFNQLTRDESYLDYYALIHFKIWAENQSSTNKRWLNVANINPILQPCFAKNENAFGFLVSFPGNHAHGSAPSTASPALLLQGDRLTISTAMPINCNNEQASHLRTLTAWSLAAFIDLKCV